MFVCVCVCLCARVRAAYILACSRDFKSNLLRLNCTISFKESRSGILGNGSILFTMSNKLKNKREKYGNIVIRVPWVTWT